MGLSRSIKKNLLGLLGKVDIKDSIAQLDKYPLKTVISPLMSFFFHHDEGIKWHAIALCGALVTQIARQDMEFARGIMRRLMWNMNDESGGIGWGASEAMGEIMADCRKLAKEYVFTLISFIDPAANYIDNCALQTGILWGIGRLAQTSPDLIKPHANLLIPFLDDASPTKRGFSAWALNNCGTPLPDDLIAKLKNDEASFTLFSGNILKQYLVRDMLLQPLGD